MKKSIYLFLAMFSMEGFSQTLATYSYNKVKSAPKKTVSFSEVKDAYELVKRTSFNPPSPKTFFNDYLRFKLGVEVGLYDKTPCHPAPIC